MYTVVRGGLGAAESYACTADSKNGFVSCTANDMQTAETMSTLRASILAAGEAVGVRGQTAYAGGFKTAEIGEWPDLRVLLELVGKVNFTKNQTLFDLKKLADYYWDPNGHPSAEGRAWVTKQLHWMLDNSTTINAVMLEVVAGKYGGLKPVVVPSKPVPVTSTPPVSTSPVTHGSALSTGKKVGLAAAAVGGLLLLGLLVRSSLKLKETHTF